jgi:hypothetical protein
VNGDHRALDIWLPLALAWYGRLQFLLNRQQATRPASQKNEDRAAEDDEGPMAPKADEGPIALKAEIATFVCNWRSSCGAPHCA